jgi:type IV secretory pathway TraG/TraD family ATPase VirD4
VAAARTAKALAGGWGRGRGASVAAGVPLGISSSGRRVGLTDAQLATHGLIVGASGAGKSTTLLRILEEQIRRGQPVVAIDLKGSPAFARRLQVAAQEAGRPLRVWSLEGPERWNPLAHGNPTELKDKLIATERFSEPHYQRAAERYLQTALQVFQARGQVPSVDDVVALLEPARLGAVARRLDSPLRERVQDYLGALTPDQLSAVRGLGTRLALLSESSAGAFLRDPAAGGIDLRAGLGGREIVLFSLNSSRYGKLAAQVGTLAIQDLVSVTGERLQSEARTRATVAIDEFSALGADHVLQLLARGRESGVSVLLATQELADLDRAGRGFRDQVLGLTAVKIAHRQDVSGSAQTIAQMAGTQLEWEVTLAMNGLLGPGSGHRGTRHLAERFVVHPNEIRTLEPGQAVILTKTPRAGVTRVRVDPPPEARVRVDPPLSARAGLDRHGLRRPDLGGRGL